MWSTLYHWIISHDLNTHTKCATLHGLIPCWSENPQVPGTEAGSHSPWHNLKFLPDFFPSPKTGDLQESLCWASLKLTVLCWSRPTQQVLSSSNPQGSFASLPCSVVQPWALKPCTALPFSLPFQLYSSPLHTPGSLAPSVAETSHWFYFKFPSIAISSCTALLSFFPSTFTLVFSGGQALLGASPGPASEWHQHFWFLPTSSPLTSCPARSVYGNSPCSSALSSSSSSSCPRPCQPLLAASILL